MAYVQGFVIPPDIPFDGQRMIFGGFAPIFDTDVAQPRRHCERSEAIQVRAIRL